MRCFFSFYIFDEVLEQGVGGENLLVASEDEAFAGASEGDIQFAVDDSSVFLEAVAGEEIELIAMLDGEGIDDDIALRTLIALDGIDGDGL